jgi:hypothetical protein
VGDHEQLGIDESDGTADEKTVGMSTGITRHRSWRRSLVLAAIPALGTGCDASNDAFVVDLDSIVERTSPDSGIWINNGLSDPSVSGVDPAHPLSSPQGMSEVDGVLASEGSRLAAIYLVECALPLGASIVKTVDGEDLVLDGRLGLAPAWEDGACDEDCQQWVSACLLARTNTNAQSIPISLRAAHPAIGFGGHPDFRIYEASFFGNLFADPEAHYMCQGSEEAAAMAEEDGRTCSYDPESCGFEAYDDCEEEDRCEFVVEDGDVTAVGCVPEGANTSYHTISVYIVDPEDDGGWNGDGGGNGGCGNGNGGNGNGGNGNGGGNDHGH